MIRASNKATGEVSIKDRYEADRRFKYAHLLNCECSRCKDEYNRLAMANNVMEILARTLIQQPMKHLGGKMQDLTEIEEKIKDV